MALLALAPPVQVTPDGGVVKKVLFEPTEYTTPGPGAPSFQLCRLGPLVALMQHCQPVPHCWASFPCCSCCAGR